MRSLVLSAMCTAKDRVVLLNSMSDDATSPVIASWSERMDGTLEAIEGMSSAVLRYLKRLVVVVSTGLTSGHFRSSLKLSPGQQWLIFPDVPRLRQGLAASYSSSMPDSLADQPANGRKAA